MRSLSIDVLRLPYLFLSIYHWGFEMMKSSIQFSTLLLLCACGGAQQVSNSTYKVTTGNPNLLIEQSVIDFGELSFEFCKV